MIVLKYGCAPQQPTRFCLCQWHLCELAVSTPPLLFELLKHLVALLTPAHARAAAEDTGSTGLPAAWAWARARSLGRG